jgi:hypothetical protein
MEKDLLTSAAVVRHLLEQLTFAVDGGRGLCCELPVEDNRLRRNSGAALGSSVTFAVV